MHCVLETDAFARAARETGITEDERQRIHSRLSEEPTAGDLIVGTGGARKLRFPKPGSGKSSGYRVITYYAAEDVPVFLLDLYAKGEKITLSHAERNELKKILATVAENYRASVKKKVQALAGVAS